MGPTGIFFILLAWCFSNPEETIDKSNNFLLHFINLNWYNHPISPTREVRETSFTGTSTSAPETGLKSMTKAETLILAAGITVGMVSLSPFVFAIFKLYYLSWSKQILKPAFAQCNILNIAPLKWRNDLFQKRRCWPWAWYLLHEFAGGSTCEIGDLVLWLAPCPDQHGVYFE